MDYIKNTIPLGDKVITTCTLKETCEKITIAGSRTTHNEHTCGADQNGNCPTYASCRAVSSRLRMQQMNQEFSKHGSKQMQRAVGE